jgi:polyferredoxin
MSNIVILLLIWLACGLIIGGLVMAADWKPTQWRWYWLLTLAIGAGVLGGLLGSWLFGPLFGTPIALWITVLFTCAPKLVVVKLSMSP